MDYGSLMVTRMTVTVIMILLCSAATGLADGKVYKVLPQLLDKQGRHTLSPSLFERDAYQEFLHESPEQRGGLRFAVLWKARNVADESLTIRVEFLSAAGGSSAPKLVEQTVKRPRFGRRWTYIQVGEKDAQNMQELLAWRVTLWAGKKEIAETRSFLW